MIFFLTCYAIIEFVIAHTNHYKQFTKRVLRHLLVIVLVTSGSTGCS